MLSLETKIPQTIAYSDINHYKNAPFFSESFTFSGYIYEMDKFASADDVLAHFESAMNAQPKVDQHYELRGITAFRQHIPFTFNAITLMHRNCYYNNRLCDIIILYPSEVSVNNLGYIKVDTFGITTENTLGIATHYTCSAEQVNNGQINLDGIHDSCNSNKTMPSCRVFLSVEKLNVELKEIYRKFNHETRTATRVANRNVNKALSALAEIA